MTDSFLSQFWNCSGLLYLGRGLATQETGGSFLSQLELVRLMVNYLCTGHTRDRWLLPKPTLTGSDYGTLVVDLPHRRQVAPSLASWNWFGLQYLSCGLATQETCSSFLSQLKPVLFLQFQINNLQASPFSHFHIRKPVSSDNNNKNR